VVCNEKKPVSRETTALHQTGTQERAMGEIEAAMELVEPRASVSPLRPVNAPNVHLHDIHVCGVGWGDPLLPTVSDAVEPKPQGIVVCNDSSQRLADERNWEMSMRTEQQGLVPVVRFRQSQLEEPVLDRRQRHRSLAGTIIAS
jgi:hypothetical protein